MIKKFGLLIIILSTFAVAFVSCDDHDTNHDNVYLAGVEQNANGISVATCWVNNVKTNLTSGIYSSNATSIFVSDGNVYVAGYEINKDGEPIAKYWMNGQETILSSAWSEATSIFIYNNDVYIAGFEKTNSGLKTTAKYWKNDASINLTPDSIDCSAKSIKVIDGDIYVVGEVVINNVLAATYWKNGNEVNLTSNTVGYAYANAIVLLNGKVCVAGKEGKNTSGIPVAKYWENGMSINLTEGDTEASANDIAISNGDVYVVGFENTADGVSRVKYWKNGTGQTLPTTSSTDFATGIKAVGSDFYMVSWEGTCWKNGREISFRNDRHTFFLNDIFVVRSVK